MTDIIELSTELVVIKDFKPAEIFVDKGLDPILQVIKKEVNSHALDVSTKEGRQFIASLAYKIAKSKTTLDEIGKNLTEEWKEKSKAVDTERKRMREALDKLKDEIRQPLTEWEDAEKARVASHESNILEITSHGKLALDNWQSTPIESMKASLIAVQNWQKINWQEFRSKAVLAIETANRQILEAISKREKYDAEQLELATLRKQAEERAQKEREERIAAKAAAKAKAEAEAQARKELEAAEKRNKELEAAKKAAEEKAAREAKEAAEAAAKRESDVKHKANIYKEITDALQLAGLSSGQAENTLNSICQGLIPHIKIQY